MVGEIVEALGEFVFEGIAEVFMFAPKFFISAILLVVFFFTFCADFVSSDVYAYRTKKDLTHVVYSQGPLVMYAPSFQSVHEIDLREVKACEKVDEAKTCRLLRFNVAGAEKFVQKYGVKDYATERPGGDGACTSEFCKLLLSDSYATPLPTWTSVRE